MIPASRRSRVGVLISGRGSNLAALLAACRAPDYPARIVVVVANRPAPGLAFADGEGVPAVVVPSRNFPDRAAHEAAMDGVLRAHGVELICLAGYMRLFTPWFVSRWAGRMLNIHPSLLPELPGLDTHARALAAGATVHGATVHLVTDEVDVGPIVGQERVPVQPGDTTELLAARVLEAEHRLYPAALRRYIAAQDEP